MIGKLENQSWEEASVKIVGQRDMTPVYPLSLLYIPYTATVCGATCGKSPFAFLFGFYFIL